MSHPSLTNLAAGCIVTAFVGTIVYLLLRTVFFPVLLPMLIAYAVAAWVRRVVAHTAVGKLGQAGEKWGGLVLTLLLCIAVLGCGVGLISTLAKQAQELVTMASTRIPWNALPGWLTAHVPMAWQSRIDTALTALIEKGATWLGSVAGGVLSSLPGAALAIFFTIAGLFYWVTDHDGIVHWVFNTIGPLFHNIPSSWQQWWHRCKPIGQAMLQNTAAYLRAQVSLSAVIFVVLSVGLGVLGIEGQMAWAALITIIDLLPLLGSGVFLLPWAGLTLLTHRTARGIGLLVLWALIWLLRQWLEPRLTGHALGVHPFGMLVGLYTGYRMGGIGGMVCAAVVLGGVGEMNNEK